MFIHLYENSDSANIFDIYLQKLTMSVCQTLLNLKKIVIFVV